MVINESKCTTSVVKWYVIRTALAGPQHQSMWHVAHFLHTSDPLAIQVLRNITALEIDADLIFLSGDMVSGYAWNHSKGWYASLWARLATTLNAIGKPYATILGNHDAQADLDRRQVASLIAGSGPLSLTRRGPKGVTGAANYRLDILASSSNGGGVSILSSSSSSSGSSSTNSSNSISSGSDSNSSNGKRYSVFSSGGSSLATPAAVDGSSAGNASITGVLAAGSGSGSGDNSSDSSGDNSIAGGRVAARIWALDSMDRGCGRLGKWFTWGCVAADTWAWVDEQAAALSPPRVPSLAFIHIPIPGAIFFFFCSQRNKQHNEARLLHVRRFCPLCCCAGRRACTSHCRAIETACLRRFVVHTSLCSVREPQAHPAASPLARRVCQRVERWRHVR